MAVLINTRICSRLTTLTFQSGGILCVAAMAAGAADVTVDFSRPTG
ncbi:MAG: hypothetical protein IJC66_05555 [Kiritimatiellae bacterium]|nr:hypothetical protein [Kiritimatiellia bacterium]